jgi:transposase
VAGSAGAVWAYTTAYNRFSRWAKRGVWGAVFRELAQRSPDSLRMIDSTVVRVHQHAAAPKKTAKKRSGARAAA